MNQTKQELNYESNGEAIAWLEHPAVLRQRQEEDYVVSPYRGPILCFKNDVYTVIKKRSMRVHKCDYSDPVRWWL